MEQHAAQCTDKGKSGRQAIRDTLEVINGKWSLVIIYTLFEGKRRFRELAKELGISPRILSRELQGLEMNKLVKRTVCDTKPVTVEYELTPYSETLKDVITAMMFWGMQHRVEIIGK